VRTIPARACEYHRSLKEITTLAEQRWQEFVGQATVNLLRWSEEKSKVMHKKRRPGKQGFPLCRI